MRVGVEGDRQAAQGPQRHIAFGPFVILAILELLFVGGWLEDRWTSLLTVT